MQYKLLSLQIGKAKEYGDKQSHEFLTKYWESGSFKEPTSLRLWAGKLGLESDEVADKIHHGGEDKAIFANSYENYKEWSEFLQKEISFGALSENLTISGLHESSVCLGDIHKIGSVVLQVSQPRKPCWKISKRWNNKKFTHEIYATGLTGWYYRVIEEGFLGAGDEVVLLSREAEQVSILDANMAFANPIMHRDILEKILSVPSLAPSYRASIEKRIIGEFSLEYMKVD